MGQQYPLSTIWETNIVVILHIYASRFISPLLCDHKDIEPELCEPEMIITGPLYTY